VGLGRTGKPEDRLRRRVCGLVFLIGQLPRETGADTGVRATKQHIADLMVDDLAADNDKLRAEVGSLLEQMAEEGILMRVGEEFRIQTEEGRNWDDEFRRREVKLKSDTAFFDERRDQYVAADVAQTVSKVRVSHGAAKVPRSLVTHRTADPPTS